MNSSRNLQMRPSLRARHALSFGLKRGHFGPDQAIIVMLFAVGLLAYGLIQDHALLLVTSAIISGLLCLWVAKEVWQGKVTGTYILNYILITGVIGKFTLLLLGALGVTAGGDGMRFSLMQKPWTILLYMNASLLVAWLFGRWLYANPIYRIKTMSTVEQIKSDQRGLEALFLLFLPLVFGGTLGRFLPETVRYFFDVAGTPFIFLPFFVGRYASPRRVVFWIWGAALVFNAVTITMIGGRFSALYPMTIFGIGFIYSLTPRLKRWCLTLAFIGFPPGLLLVGSLGVIRDELGRDDIRNVSVSHAARMSDLAGQLSWSDHNREMLLRALGRMTPWSNYAPPALSPEIIPYRGFATFPQEAVNTAAIYAFAPHALGARLELNMGTLPANDYGYMVNDSNSVEWGVIADGWSRGGWWSGLLFLGFAYGLCFVLERWIWTSSRLRPAIKVIFVSFLIGWILRSGAIPLLDFLRGFVLYSIPYVTVLLMANACLNALLPLRGRSVV